MLYCLCVTEFFVISHDGSYYYNHDVWRMWGVRELHNVQHFM